MIICVITARGGSKRIPRKNIKDFCGKPMISYSIEAALASQCFDRVVVSTDDEEIAGIAKTLGAEIPFIRPEELSDDYASTDAVFLHALETLGGDGSISYACCLYPTAPFVRPSDLNRGLELLKSSNATSGIAVAPFDFPIFRALKSNEQGRLNMVWPEHRLTRSQDLPETCHDAGQFYWVNVEKYLKERAIYSSDAVAIPLPPHLVNDIDMPEDWQRAELMYKALLSDES